MLLIPEAACQPKLTRSRFTNPDRTVQERLHERLPRRAEHRLGLIEAIRHPAARAMRWQTRMRSTTSLFNDSGHLIDVIGALLTTQVVVCANPLRPPPHSRRPCVRASTHKARDCVARGDQNISSAFALGNLVIEGATDLARENLIAAIDLNPPAVRTVVHGAVLGCVHGGHGLKSARQHGPLSTWRYPPRGDRREAGALHI